MRIPAELTQRAKELVYGGGWTPPPARPAATVVLLRDARDGFEVVVMQRSRSLRFAGSMFVFPGGAVDPEDAELGDPWRVAAVRETFEECGVLLGVPDPDPGALAAVRLLPFGEALSALSVAPALAILQPFAHWVTPEVEQRRFDTRFFAARVPAGQDLADVTTEHQNVQWADPRAALDLPMLPPTRAVLTELARFDSVAQVLSVPRDPVPIMPRPVASGDGEIEWRLVHAETGQELG